MEVELWIPEQEMGEVKGWCIQKPRASVLSVTADPWW